MLIVIKVSFVFTNKGNNIGFSSLGALPFIIDESTCLGYIILCSLYYCPEMSELYSQYQN